LLAVRSIRSLGDDFIIGEYPSLADRSVAPACGRSLDGRGKKFIDLHLPLLHCRRRSLNQVSREGEKPPLVIHFHATGSVLRSGWLVRLDDGLEPGPAGAVFGVASKLEDAGRVIGIIEIDPAVRIVLCEHESDASKPIAVLLVIVHRLLERAPVRG